MGLLKQAKDKAPADDKEPKKKKKHPSAQESAPPASQAPDNSVQADSGDSDAAEDEQPAPDSQSDDSDSSQPPSAPEADGGDEGQGQPDDEQSGADQQQDAQGPTPVKNPQAPGAGDNTSGGADTPDQGPQTPGADTQAGPGANADLPQVPMSPGLQDEYEKANAFIMQKIYSMPGDAAAKAVLSALTPDGPNKIRGPVHISLLLLTQMHKQINLPPQLVLPVLKDVVAHVLDLGGQVKGIQYSDQESVAILGTAYEGAMRIWGVSKGQMQNLAHHIGKKTIMAHAAKHKAALAFAKPGIDAVNNSANGQAAGPTQTAGPQSGAPPGAQATPQQGAPPQQPPPQGGMLQQAAAASPAAQGEEA
jgi:hypothetical protein